MQKKNLTMEQCDDVTFRRLEDVNFLIIECHLIGISNTDHQITT